MRIAEPNSVANNESLGSPVAGHAVGQHLDTLRTFESDMPQELAELGALLADTAPGFIESRQLLRGVSVGDRRPHHAAILLAPRQEDFAEVGRPLRAGHHDGEIIQHGRGAIRRHPDIVRGNACVRVDEAVQCGQASP